MSCKQWIYCFEIIWNVCQQLFSVKILIQVLSHFYKLYALLWCDGLWIEFLEIVIKAQIQVWKVWTGEWRGSTANEGKVWKTWGIWSKAKKNSGWTGQKLQKKGLQRGETQFVDLRWFWQSRSISTKASIWRNWWFWQAQMNFSSFWKKNT